MTRQWNFVSLNKAINRLRERTDDTKPIMAALQDGALPTVIRLPGNPGGFVGIPRTYWANFDYTNIGAKEKPLKGLHRKTVLRVQVGSLRELNQVIAAFSKRVWSGDKVITGSVPPELRPWFRNFKLDSEAADQEPISREQAEHLVDTFLHSAHILAPIQVYESDLRSFDDYIRMNIIDKRKYKPRPIDEAFWFELIRALQITQMNTGIEGVKAHLKAWASGYCPATFGTDPFSS